MSAERGEHSPDWIATAGGYVMLLGVPLGVIPMPKGSSGLWCGLRQGIDAVEFEEEAVAMMQYAAVPRTPAQFLEWLTANDPGDPVAQFFELLDARVLLHLGVDQPSDIETFSEIKLLPRGTAKGVLGRGRDLYAIAGIDNKNAVVDELLYWTWVCSDGRSLASAAITAGEALSLPPDTVLPRLAVDLRTLLMGGVAYLDLAE